MNAHNTRASQNADDDGRRRARDAFSEVVAGDPGEFLIKRAFNERFARGSEQNGQIEFGHDAIELVDQLQVLFRSLPETDAGIQNYPLPRRSAADRLLY